MTTNRSRLVELFIDPNSGQLSMSRSCVGLMCVGAFLAGLCCAYRGEGQWAAAIFTGVTATVAGIYWRSTGKNFKDNCGCGDKE